MPYIPKGYLMYRADPDGKEFSRLEQKFLFIPECWDHTILAQVQGYYETKRWDGKKYWLDKTGDASLKINVHSKRLKLEEAIDKFIRKKEGLIGVTLDYKQIQKFIRAGNKKDGFGRDLFPQIPDYARRPICTVWEMYFRL